MCLTAGDPIDFLSWILNTLHTALNGTKKLSSSIINQTFRGQDCCLLLYTAYLNVYVIMHVYH